MAKTIDLYIDQGSDFIATFPPVTDNNGQVVNLSGYTVKCYIRRSYTTSNAIAMTVVENQFASGIITITLEDDQTSGLTATRWVYDVTIQDPNTDLIVKVFEGLAIVNPGVTSKPNTTLLTPYLPDDYGGLY